jgi:amidase
MKEVAPHVNVLCRTLRDAAAALDALHGPAPGEKYVIAAPTGPYAAEVGADPGHLHVRWTVDAWSGAPVAPECRAAVEAVTAALADAGHDVDKGAPAIDSDVDGDCNTVGRAVGDFFEAANVLLLPSVARLPWRLGELNQDDPALDADGWVRKVLTYIPFTAMFNVTGHPAISLPLAWSDGLPVGVQLVGCYGDEATLFRLAAQLEEAFPWADRAPPIAVG